MLWLTSQRPISSVFWVEAGPFYGPARQWSKISGLDIKRIFHKQLPAGIFCNCLFKHEQWLNSTGMWNLCPRWWVPMSMVNSLATFQGWLRSEELHGSPMTNLCWKSGFLSYKQLQTPGVGSIMQSWLWVVSPLRQYFSASLSSIYVLGLHQI